MSAGFAVSKWTMRPIWEATNVSYILEIDHTAVKFVVNIFLKNMTWNNIF